MAGIVFFRTDQREAIVDLYTADLGFGEWLEQDGGCTILKRENLLVGFCDASESETEGIVTIVVEDRETVDDLYGRLDGRARGPPETNDEFDIYQFFLEDPDGRAVEVQTFLHDTPSVS
ncbi:VOC family protein [Halovenus sp. HT40]|uniref:VOC family protein n=1 Tax=Halovenus sp. HT40 TaxID=3126691 RepID=UPI00300F2861